MYAHSGHIVEVVVHLASMLKNLLESLICQIFKSNFFASYLYSDFVNPSFGKLSFLSSNDKCQAIGGNIKYQQKHSAINIIFGTHETNIFICNRVQFI